MESPTKKLLAFGVLFILVGGATAYYLKNKNKEESEKDLGSNANEDALNQSVNTPASSVATKATKTSTPATKPSTKAASAPTKTASVNTGVSKAQIAKANDLLAGNIKAADAKPIYALADGVSVYNMKSEKAFVAKKGQYLGVCSYSRESGANGYIMYFLGAGAANVKYWTTSNSIGVKIN